MNLLIICILALFHLLHSQEIIGWNNEALELSEVTVFGLQVAVQAFIVGASLTPDTSIHRIKIRLEFWNVRNSLKTVLATKYNSTLVYGRVTEGSNHITDTPG